MTKEQIVIYARQITRTDQITILRFKDYKDWVGYFETDKDNLSDEANNVWSFVPFNQENIPKKKFHFKGDDLLEIEIKNKKLL